MDIRPLTSVDMRPAGGRELTVVSQDDDVETSVEADLLQAVHQLTHDPVHVLDGQNQLQDRNVENTWTKPRAPLCVSAPWWIQEVLQAFQLRHHQRDLVIISRGINSGLFYHHVLVQPGHVTDFIGGLQTCGTVMSSLTPPPSGP